MAKRKERRRKTYYQRMNPMERYDEQKFIERYRISKDCVSQIAKDLVASGISSTALTKRGGGLSVEERVCIALRYYATGANYSLVGDYQGVHKSTVCHCVSDLSRYFYRKQKKYMQFPWTLQERQAVASQFYHKHGNIPLVLGCLDGTHIPILTPKDNDKNYLNRKNYHSMNALVICDSNKVITHLDTRWPGAINDAYILKESIVHELGEGKELGSYFFLGDSGYPLRPYLFTPLLRPRTRAEKRYNRWQKTTRSMVESTIGILKQRWRCIDNSGGYLHHTPAMACKIITACVCLHNLARRNAMPLPPPEDEEDRDGVRPVRQERVIPPSATPEGRPREQVLRKRANFIENHFGQTQ